jgi:hypothetical protein
MCVVADRGMISADTIAELEARGIDYILGARERSTTEVRQSNSASSIRSLQRRGARVAPLWSVSVSPSQAMAR